MRSTVTLPVGMSARLSYEARRSSRSASAVVRDALAAYFATPTEGRRPSFVGIAASKAGAAPARRADKEISRIMRGKAAEIMGRSAKAERPKAKRPRRR